MDRIIKFRAWDAANECFNDTVAGNLLMQLHEPSEDVDPEYGKRFFLQQFTGLKDIWGVEIYEGDIVRILYTDWPSNTNPEISLEDYLISISHVGVVEYEAPMFGIRMIKENRYGEKPFGSFNYGAHGRLEVIGNIYQNPELLTNNPS